jgi:Zn finger protein HypA/HybF involved in hydrogenase expression
MRQLATKEHVVPVCPECGSRKWAIVADNVPLNLVENEEGRWYLELAPVLMVDTFEVHCEHCNYYPEEESDLNREIGLFLVY